MKRIRLINVIVQPVYDTADVPAKDWSSFSKLPLPEIKALNVTPTLILDDGEDLSPLPSRTATIPIEEWKTYSDERFPKEIQELEKSFNE